jgi:hypothetical protein
MEGFSSETFLYFQDGLMVTGDGWTIDLELRVMDVRFLVVMERRLYEENKQGFYKQKGVK